MAGVVDADTHIAESEAMWGMMDGEMRSRRPILLTVPDDTVYGARNAFWLIDGNIFPKPAGKGSFRLITPSASKLEMSRGDIHLACREMTDVRGRLGDMDRLGVEIQVVYPTLFLIYLTDDPALEVALCRAYNRFLAKACARSGSRMRWVVVPPLKSLEEAIDELKWGKDNGAVGVFFRGIEGSWTLDHPYLFPLYAAANDLELPICIHTGAGCPAFLSLFDVERNHTFGHSRIQPLLAFRDIVANGIPERFPRLKFGFIEASAGWVPFLLHVLKRLLKAKWKFSSDPDLFREYRIFVACEADEDVNYIANFTGEDHLIIGSDYGHQDPSEERQLVAAMRAREDIPRALTDKILTSNPRRFYPLH
ncbi:MAG TPA: amidohydrolase family protein [candidate division Zixibacteria bacterium]|nr:amidohydrolase family protein [candidate division Zixibacteria bacterium]